MGNYNIALPQIDSPVDQYGKALTLANLVSQRQQAQQAMTDDASYRTAIQNNPDGGTGLLRDLASSGNYKAYAATQKADLDAQHTKAQIGQANATAANTQMDVLNKAFTIHRDLLNTVNTPADAAKWVASAYQDPVLGPLVASTGSIDDATKRIPTTPKEFQDWKLQSSLNAEKYVQQTRPDANTVLNNQTSTENNQRTVDATIENNKRTTEATKLSLKEGTADLPPEQNALITRAVAEGRLDPNRINSRTAGLYANMLATNPDMDFSKTSADIALSRNATFRQRAMTAQVLPEIMGNMVESGKKIGFNDNRTLGKMQEWVKGEFNDPAYTEYMSQRNDALMTIAAVMRGNGMSDMAHKAEMEVAAPSMSPAALDAWMKGQLKSLEPRVHLNNQIINHGNAQPAPAAAPNPGMPPLDSFFIKK